MTQYTHVLHNGNRSGKVLKPLTVAKRAYIAGIIDGEGSVHISRKTDPTMRRGYCYRVNVSVVNTDLALIRWLHKSCGLGSVKPAWRANLKHKPAARWELWSIQAYQLLASVWPFLLIKKKRAALCMRLLEAKNTRSGCLGLSRKEWDFQESIYRKMKVLNKRGVA